MIFELTARPIQPLVITMPMAVAVPFGKASRGSSAGWVLLDIWLPGKDVPARIQEMPFPDRPMVVVISGYGNIETAVRAIKPGAFDFVVKNAIGQHRLEPGNRLLVSRRSGRHEPEDTGRGGARHIPLNAARSRPGGSI